MDLKTSEEWQKVCNIRVLDQDGWDRKNFTFSWHEELITREEFLQRLAFSTCEFTVIKITAVGLAFPVSLSARRGPQL